MKPSKILLYTLIVAAIIFALMFLTGCTNDETHTSESISIGWWHRITIVDHYSGGMHYKVFMTSDSGGLGVVNVTLDSLQVEQLKKISYGTSTVTE